VVCSSKSAVQRGKTAISFMFSEILLGNFWMQIMTNFIYQQTEMDQERMNQRDITKTFIKEITNIHSLDHTTTNILAQDTGPGLAHRIDQGLSLPYTGGRIIDLTPEMTQSLGVAHPPRRDRLQFKGHVQEIDLEKENIGQDAKRMKWIPGADLGLIQEIGQGPTLTRYAVINREIQENRLKGNHQYPEVHLLKLEPIHMRINFPHLVIELHTIVLAKMKKLRGWKSSS